MNPKKFDYSISLEKVKATDLKIGKEVYVNLGVHGVVNIIKLTIDSIKKLEDLPDVYRFKLKEDSNWYWYKFPNKKEAFPLLTYSETNNKEQ